MKIRLSSMEETAKTRPEGYLQDCLSRGIIDGPFLQISPAEYQPLLAKYRPPSTINSPHPQPHQIAGLGDLVHAVAHPLAKATDRILGTNLQNCGGCARRRETLNRALPLQ